MSPIIHRISRCLPLIAIKAGLFLFFLSLPATVWTQPCNCKGQSVEEAYQNHPLIFMGKVVEETRVKVLFYIENDDGQRVPLYEDRAQKLEVEVYQDEYWKENPGKTITLISTYPCSIYLFKKIPYLIYTFPNKEKTGTDGLGLDRCTRTVRYLDSFPEQFTLNDILRKGALRQETQELHRQALSDENLDQRARALRQLGLLPGKTIPEDRVKIFMKAVQHEDINIRLTALIALHDKRLKGHPEVVHKLKKNLKDSSPYVRAVAVYTLAEIGTLDDPTVTMLISLFDAESDLPARNNREHDLVFHALSHALSGIHKEGVARRIVPHLLKRINGVRGWRYPVRMQVTEDLRNLGPLAEPAVPALKKMLGDEILKVRDSAVETLKTIGTPVALEALK